MTATLIQSPTLVIANNVTSTTLAYGSNLTAGNFIIAYQSQWHSGVGSSTIQTPVDTRSHTYVANGAQQNTAGNEQRMRAYHKASCSAGACTVTFASDQAATDITGVVGEFAGVATTTPIDVSQTNGATSASATSNATATATANDLAIGLITFDGLTATISPTNLLNSTLQENEANSTSAGIGVSYKLDIGASATVTATWTLGASRAYIARVDTFKLPAATARPVKMAGEWGGFAGSSGGFAG